MRVVMQYAWYFKLEPKQGKKKLLTLALPSEQNTLQYLYIYIYIYCVPTKMQNSLALFKYK